MLVARLRLRTSARLLSLVLLLLAACPLQALAHAVLTASTPAANSVSAKSPDRIELFFNEPVQVLALRLIDGVGQDRSPAGAPDVSDGRVVWLIKQPLADGRYLVSWRVASLDGHVIGGTFEFSVGAGGTIAPVLVPTLAEPSHWPALALHALVRLSMLFAAGTALFRLLLAPRGLDAMLRRATRWLAIVGVVATGLFVGADGTLRMGVSILQMYSGDVWRAALDAPNVALRAVMLTGFVLLAATRARALQWAGIAGTIVGIADTGHVLAVLPAGVGQALMILHGLAAALWVGAIAPLRLALARDEGPAPVAVFRRFQSYGALAMGATVGSGIVVACLLLPRLVDLWQSGYGLRLCLKLLAVAVMLGIAVLNRLWLTRRALAERSGMCALLRRVLALDLVAAIMATVLAVGLSLGAPPERSLQIALTSDRYDVTLALSPGKPGDNTLIIALAPKAGAPAEPKEVEVRLTAPGIEAITRKAERVGVGRYRAAALPLWAAGPWQIRLGLLVDDFTKLPLSAEFTLSP